MVINNFEYDITGLVTKTYYKTFYNPSNSKFNLKLGYFEAKETENIWLRHLRPYRRDMRQIFVKNIEMLEGFYYPGRVVNTEFFFSTDLIDSYEKYPESLMSGLTKIGGILALVRIV